MIKFIDFCEVWFLPESVARVDYPADIHDYLTELGSERERNLGVPSRVSNLGVRKKGRQTKIGDKICVRECLNSSCMRLYFAAVYFCILERILFRNTISFSDWTGVSGGISSRSP
ncbi:hypothetical protein TNCV_3906971 [Trichonephila clavipes]|nr:hypothetical protein TNCV_3906971 [Trichonephila clavipes]